MMSKNRLCELFKTLPSFKYKYLKDIYHKSITPKQLKNYHLVLEYTNSAYIDDSLKFLDSYRNDSVQSLKDGYNIIHIGLFLSIVNKDHDEFKLFNNTIEMLRIIVNHLFNNTNITLEDKLTILSDVEKYDDEEIMILDQQKNYNILVEDILQSIPN